jgi:inosose dehydratase
MSSITFGCQTYTWQMSGPSQYDSLEHIIGVGAAAGFTGLEPEMIMLGRLSDPVRLKSALEAKRMKLGALCLVEDWLGTTETAKERAEADVVIRNLKTYFPSTLLALCQMPGTDRSHLQERQRNLLACANSVARRAVSQGVHCTYHPNSPPGSIFRTADDYQVLLNGLDASACGYAPDLGHIAKGGMDPLTVVKTYRSLINHLHFKDMASDGSWAAMGEGVIDFTGVVRFLQQTGYQGWIMVEDECPRAEHDPDGATAHNGAYVREQLMPLTVSTTSQAR